MSGPGIDYREELARLGESGRDSSKECEGEGWCVSLTAGRSWSAVFGREKKRERESKEWRTTMTKAVIVNAGYD